MIINAHNKRAADYIRELWQHRELLYFLTWRHMLVRYKQTVFGVLWSIFRPLLATAVLVLVFHRFIGLQSGDIPYPLIVISGLLLWHLFANSVSSGGTSLVSEQVLITRTYVPRLILPLSVMLVNMVEVFITLVLVLALMAYYELSLGWEAAFGFVAIALTFVLAAATAFIFTALHAKFRDVAYVIPFFLQIGFYLSPIAFTASHVPEGLHVLYFLNPLVGYVEAFRWSLFPGELLFPFQAFTYSLVITGILTLCSLLFFFKTERTIADVI